MPTGPDARILADLLQAGVCFWVNHSSLGNAKSRNESPDLPLNPNIVPCPLPILRSFGFVAYLQIWGFLIPLLPHFMRTILVPSVSLRIQSFMNRQNIEVDCHFIRDEYDRKVISLPHVSSELQVADIFTKGLPRPHHEFLIRKLLLFD